LRLLLLYEMLPLWRSRHWQNWTILDPVCHFFATLLPHFFLISSPLKHCETTFFAKQKIA